ncbi:hypothetical protein C9374_014739 [Naegleria lovaniensis]|uniref:Uncharacterized protein n=1 Tax=Naegleria lovaniensis TaxID=51637 RepID=A0AA88GAU8_NAELO|nr:uncharacterized protein C9374_014739 [Naegleria lovaniensis]KAG2370619.1 hypothetical protein C9374_014739 [Naegleria lovaniensis]
MQPLSRLWRLCTVSIHRSFECSERRTFTLQREISTSSSNARVFQRLPRHLRRRAMSKVPHLLPRHLRNAAIREMNLPKRVRQRKRRKDMKRKQQRKDFVVNVKQLPALNGEANTKAFRLSTHIFHAKRMKMEDKWGMRLPVKHITDKIFRNGYRYIRRHCTIHERSYMVCLQVDFNTAGNVEKLLKSMMNIHIDSSLLFHNDYLVGKREGSFEWKDKHNFTISTVEFLVRPKTVTFNGASEESIMIWIHPSSLPEGYRHLEQLVKDLNGDIYHRNDLSRMERMKTDIQMATSLPVDMVLSFMAKHPIYTSSFNTTFEDFKKESQLIATAIAPSLSYTSSQSSSKDNAKSLNSLQKKSMVYVPDRMNDIALIWNQKECKARYQFPYLKRNKRTSKKFNPLQSAEGPRSYPILLIQKPSSLNNGSSMGGGFDIILPTVDVSAHVWFKLSEQKNTMALPIFDRDRLLLEQGKRVFPNDYPSSQAFQRDVVAQNEHLEDFIQQLSCPLSSYRPVQLFGIWGGSLEPYDMIFVPTNQQQIIALTKLAKPSKDNKELEAKMHAIPKSMIEAKCIGFVTSANYSLLRGKKYGIGFITLESSQQLPSIPGHSQNIVLIKRKDESNEFIILSNAYIKFRNNN